MGILVQRAPPNKEFVPELSVKPDTQKGWSDNPSARS